MEPTQPFGIIYLATCNQTSKSYVGQTTFTIEVRWKRHVEGGAAFVFGKAIQKYGANNFTLTTLDIASSQEELDEKEIHWIKELNTLVPNGYNLTEGGRGGRHSDASKAKMSASRRGKPLSESHREKARAGLLARYEWERSVGIKRPKSEAQLNMLRTANLNKTMSPEVKAKISASHMGIRPTEDARKKMSQAKQWKGTWPDRESLQKMVWSEPMEKVAKQVGCCWLLLKKKCTELGLEVPPRGYWRNHPQKPMSVAESKSGRLPIE